MGKTSSNLLARSLDTILQSTQSKLIGLQDEQTTGGLSIFKIREIWARFKVGGSIRTNHPSVSWMALASVKARCLWVSIATPLLFELKEEKSIGPTQTRFSFKCSESVR